MEFDVPYARDYTRIIRHRSKQAKLSDFNLTGMPGGGLDGWASLAGGVAALIAALLLVPIWMWVVPWPNMLVTVPLIVIAAAVYLMVQRDTGGRDGPLVALQRYYIRLRQPKSVTRFDVDTSATHFNWVAIVLRQDGARGPIEPVRQFREYGYLDGEPAAPVQGREWPAASESIAEWQYRIWWEKGGELIEDAELADAIAVNEVPVLEGKV